MTIDFDAFNRADENPLSGGGKWTQNGSIQPIALSGNQCSASAAATACGMLRNTIGSSLRGWTEAQVTSALTNYGYVLKLFLRQNNTYPRSWYEAQVNNNQSFIYKYDDVGGFTSLNSGSNAHTAGDIYSFAIDVSGNMVLYQNGLSILTASDNSLSAGLIGIGCNDTGVVFDNWRGGDGAYPGTVITPTPQWFGNVSSGADITSASFTPVVGHFQMLIVIARDTAGASTSDSVASGGGVTTWAKRKQFGYVDNGTPVYVAVHTGVVTSATPTTAAVHCTQSSGGTMPTTASLYAIADPNGTPTVGSTGGGGTTGGDVSAFTNTGDNSFTIWGLGDDNERSGESSSDSRIDVHDIATIQKHVASRKFFGTPGTGQAVTFNYVASGGLAANWAAIEVVPASPVDNTPKPASLGQFDPMMRAEGWF